MSLLIGVDIGTQGTKAVLFSSDGRCLAQAFEASKLHTPRSGVVEEDPECQFASVCRTICQCVAEADIAAEEVAGIGIDGQMAGVIGIGADGKAVTPYDSWLDTRCAEQIAVMERQAGDRVVARTGCAPSYNHGPKILWWKTQRKGDYRRVASFVQPGGYAAMRLCGLDASQAFIDETYLHFSGFADNRLARWDSELCELFDVDEAKLPRIVKPSLVVGGLTAAAARSCKLKRGTPVVAGCGDTAASFLAGGAVREGICVDVAGTASVFAATTASFKADRRHRMLGCGRSVIEGLWHPYAYINGGGMNLKWFQSEITSRGGDTGTLTLRDLDAAAAKLSLSDGLPLFLPHLGGRVSPSQPHLRGAWAGLTWDHQAAHLYRAVLEAVPLEYALYKRVLGSLYRDFAMSELRVTGGGEVSRLWNQIKADVLGVPVRRIDRSLGAPAGAALVAAHGVGLVRSLPAAAKRWIKVGEKVSPDRNARKLYDRRIEVYEDLLRRLDGVRL